MIKIFHITSLENAIKIANKMTYNAASSNPLNFDSCLNCFCTKKKGQNFKNEGATIYFEWYGNVVKIKHNNTSTPYKKNILYNQEPWRCFIPVGTKSKCKLLKVIDIIPDDIKDKTKKELVETLKLIKNNDIFISIK